MTDKTSFTLDEWKTVKESVMMAGMAVTAADPSGLWGLLQESFASGSAIADVKTDAGEDGFGRSASVLPTPRTKEAGFIGGVPVSEAEKATLSEISSALKLAA